MASESEQQHAAQKLVEENDTGSLPGPSLSEGVSRSQELPTHDTAIGKEKAQQIGEHHNQFATFEHDYLIKHIIFADQKAAIWFAVISGSLLYFLESGEALIWLREEVWNFTVFCAFFMTVLLVISAGCALYVILPRLTGNPVGIIYWRASAFQEPLRQYVDKVVQKTEKELFDEKLSHCYELANICKTKYNVLAASMYAGAIALLLALVIHVIR